MLEVLFTEEQEFSMGQKEKFLRTVQLYVW